MEEEEWDPDADTGAALVQLSHFNINDIEATKGLREVQTGKGQIGNQVNNIHREQAKSPETGKVRNTKQISQNHPEIKHGETDGTRQEQEEGAQRLNIQKANQGQVKLIKTITKTKQ